MALVRRRKMRVGTSVSMLEKEVEKGKGRVLVVPGF